MASHAYIYCMLRLLYVASLVPEFRYQVPSPNLKWYASQSESESGSLGPFNPKIEIALHGGRPNEKARAVVR